jgi:beta-glucosidase/6-phospho-beta-glucosidase/beta-galactosidase
VGISLNTCFFDGFDPLGWVLAKLGTYLFTKRTAAFFSKCDFIGMSYYAYIPFNPLPISEIKNKGKLAQMGLPHDQMWGYNPEGMFKNIMYLWETYKKPIVITESGICTADDSTRMKAIQDYLTVIHRAMNEHQVTINGYIHWSAWDNFEWNLGNTFCFGLLRTNFETMERENTPSADFYRQIAATNEVDLTEQLPEKAFISA